MKACKVVYRYSPNKLQELSSALKSCALEADKVPLRLESHFVAQSLTYNYKSSFTTTAEAFFGSVVVDEQLGKRPDKEQHLRTFKGYADAPRRANVTRTTEMKSNKRVPRDA